MSSMSLILPRIREIVFENRPRPDPKVWASAYVGMGTDITSEKIQAAMDGFEAERQSQEALRTLAESEGD